MTGGFGLWEVVKQSLNKRNEDIALREKVTHTVFSSASLPVFPFLGAEQAVASALRTGPYAPPPSPFEDSLNPTAPASRQLFPSSKPAMRKAQNTLNSFISLSSPFPL